MRRIVVSCLFVLLTISLCACKNNIETQLPSDSDALSSASTKVAAQNNLQSENLKNTSVHNEFQTFIDRWELSGLLPECAKMTAENQDDFVKYFQKFDDVTQNYIILLLQEIAAGTSTVIDKTVIEHISDYKYGIYLNYCSLCLYDMNQDGFPELIILTGSCEADYMYTVYTVVDGKLINCGELSGSHSALYTNGSGKLVRYAGHMGVYGIDISTLDGTTLNTQEIASGILDDSKNEEYPDLDNYGYGDYDQYMTFSGIPTLFLAPAG